MSGAITVPLACPRCGSERLETIERITGYASTLVITRVQTDGGEKIDIAWAGDTVVDWNSSTTVGVHCVGCDWGWHGEDWADQLAPTATTASSSTHVAENAAATDTEAGERCLAAAAAFVGLVTETDRSGRGHVEGLESFLGVAEVEAWRQLVAAVAEVGRWEHWNENRR